MKVLMIVLFVFVSSVASAEVFDIPPSNNWTKVQNGEVIQWSIIPINHKQTRIDLISYTEEGRRTTYYLVRSACPDSKIVSGVIKAGNKVGIGLDCGGQPAVKTATLLEEVSPLPPEAKKLLDK